MANFLTDALRKYNVGGMQDYQFRTPEQQEMASGEVVKAREVAPNDALTQNPLAAAEHQDFARQLASNLGPLGYAMDLGYVPAYELAKATGMMSGRSDPSMQSMASGFEGANEGLADWLKRF